VDYEYVFSLLDRLPDTHIHILSNFQGYVSNEYNETLFSFYSLRELALGLENLIDSKSLHQGSLVT
jgi:hypothetical protein